jgi:hypothetical protein
MQSVLRLYNRESRQVYLALFVNDTCIYVTDCKKEYVLRKLQHGFNSIETWCKRWNIKIN